jgi:cellulase/cellobiase CelA1
MCDESANVCIDTCQDELKSGDETDVDCGGSCEPCALGSACLVDADCSEGTCEEDVCTIIVAPTCEDSVQNGDETDVDCGGSCDPCEEGESCNVDADCAEGTCDSGTCVVSTTSEFEASIRIDSDWGSGYCATIELTNDGSLPTKGWSALVDLNGSTTSSAWSGNYSPRPDGFQVSNLGWNGIIQPGQTTAQVGFCANRQGGAAVAEVLSATASY